MISGKMLFYFLAALAALFVVVGIIGAVMEVIYRLKDKGRRGSALAFIFFAEVFGFCEYLLFTAPELGRWDRYFYGFFVLPAAIVVMGALIIAAINGKRGLSETDPSDPGDPASPLHPANPANPIKC